MVEAAARCRGRAFQRDALGSWAVAAEVWERIKLGGRSLALSLQSVWATIEAGWLTALSRISGASFLAAAGSALDDIARAAEALTANRGEVTGLLRINAPRVALEMALTPILAKLAWAHPSLTVEVHADDALVDIVARGFDAGIRIGEAVQQDMVAMRLTGPFKAILVASKAYVEAKGSTEDH